MSNGEKKWSHTFVVSSGPIDPHDVLAVLGIKELQSVAINDKHI